MDIKELLNEYIDVLCTLEVTTLKAKKDLIDHIIQMPADMLADMEKAQFIGLLLDDIGTGAYDFESGLITPKSNKVFSFDTEAIQISTMYTNFLNGLNAIANNDFIITEIVEDLSQVNFESGTGIQTVRFQCNNSTYHYDALSYNDWFDTKILPFMGQIINELNTGKRLYATSDSWQNCILFYKMEEWAHNFECSLGITLERL